VLLLLALLTTACALYRPGCSAGMEVVARGLTQPRGLAVGPDGALYAAEAGNDEIGGRVSRVRADGSRETLATGLPHSVNAGVEDIGAAAVGFLGDQLYVLSGEAGGQLASSLLRWRAGRLEPVADLLAVESRLNPDNAGVESNPFAMLPDGDAFLVVDAAGNDVLRVGADGSAAVVAAFSDDPVPTGLARGPDGALYLALFGGWPHEPGRGRIERLGADGGRRTVVGGLTMPIAVAFDRGGIMHVLEFSAGLDLQPRLRFRPDSGRLLRVVGARAEVVVDGLHYPTALVVDPDGALLLADRGAISPPASGVVLRYRSCRGIGSY
jgi:sugar lactone lactonase YvrE